MKTPLVALVALLVSLPSFVVAEHENFIQPLSAAGGRFVFGQIGLPLSRQLYMLDTQTGRLWQVKLDENRQQVLEPVPYIQVLGNQAYVPDAESDIQAHKQASLQQKLKELEKKK